MSLISLFDRLIQIPEHNPHFKIESIIQMHALDFVFLRVIGSLVDSSKCHRLIAIDMRADFNTLEGLVEQSE